MIAIGAGIAALACIGAGIGIGIATSKAAEAVARQPEAESKITKILLLGGALAEATAIYGFVIGILIILSNACICKLFCDDLRRLKLHEQKESSERAFCEWKFRIVIRKLESET